MSKAIPIPLWMGSLHLAYNTINMEKIIKEYTSFRKQVEKRDILY